MSSNTEPPKSIVRAYGLSDGRVVTAREFAKEFLAKESKQADPQSWYSREGFVEPPYQPSRLLEYALNNPVHAACCEQIASDTAGAEWTLDPVDRESQKGNPGEEEVARSFLEKPNPTIGLRAILTAAQKDFEMIGWMDLELGRDNAKPEGAKTPRAELYHVPAHTIRRHSDKWRFRQSWSNSLDKRWFKLYGRKESVNLKTGEVSARSLSPENSANELFHLWNYTAKSTYYGVPAAIPAIGAIIGMGSLRDYNLAFFENHAIPEFAILIQGASDLEEEWRTEIQRALREQFQGAQNEHKTALLCFPGDVTVRIERLGAEVRDFSFERYKRSLVEDILMAHRVPPYRIGIEKVGALGGTNILVANEIYKHGVVRPRKANLEEVINTILRDVLGVKTWVFRFKEMDTRDLNAEVERHKALFDAAAISPNELRARFDLGDAYAGGDSHYVHGVPTEMAGMMSAEKAADRGPTLLQLLRYLNAAIYEEFNRRRGHHAA